MAHEAIISLLKTLSRLLELCHHSDINQQIISINDKSVALQFRHQNGSENLEEQIKEAAITTKEMIEYFLSEDNPLYGGRVKPTAEHLNQLKGVAEYFESTPGDAAESADSERQLKDISPSASASRRSASKDVIIGLDEDLRDMKKWIVGSNLAPQLQVLSIVRTGGIGKTTLAKLVYNDESVVKHFDIRAWVTVSQDYSVGNIVFKLLASLGEGGIRVESDGQREISMESLIKAHLNRGKFLIAIDDVCSKKAWDDLKRLFPDNGSCSRIMLTTRLQEVADYVNSSIPVHFMRLLDAHQSWDLLKKKVFVDESCPIQLDDIGREIVKICGGLPLSIVMVAGILSTLPKVRYSWKQYAANHGTLGTLETVITRSYNHLPRYMRECFLYLGGFPEDYDIRVSELIKCPTGCKSLEEEAVEVLDNMVERNLVIVGKRKFDGKIKSCILHDIVRDFCIRESQREKFLLSVMDFLPTLILRRDFLPQLLKTYGRISASSHDLDLKDFSHSLHTHSIICMPRRGYKCVSSMHKFSSLKVFHVLRRNDNWEWEPSRVLDLIHIIYLSSNITITPATILNFENLQTLIIYRSEVVLPVEIWNLWQLRNLMAFSFDSLPQPKWGTLPLKKLQVMSLVIDLMGSERMMEMIPNIKKLGICYRSFMEALNINHLGYLQQLEKLKLVSLENPQCDSAWKNAIFPLSMKKLTLCGLRLPWRDLRIIGCLPDLQVLKLRNYTCHGTSWETNEGEFTQLEFLMVDESNLLEWETKSSHFPKLKSLVLHRCPYLREIPHDMGNISTLESIKVDAGNKSLVDSAKMIQMDQETKGNYNIQVCYSNVFSTQQRKLAEDVVNFHEEDLSSPAFSSSLNLHHLWGQIALSGEKLDTTSSLSLDHLPHHLKECFLYMAAFPKDYEIRASEITKLWVAEGFLKYPIKTRSFEEEAEDYLCDLAQRSLVLVTSKKADGKIKSFRLHETVQDLCIREAVRHKFILPVMDDFPSTIVRNDFQCVSASWYDLEDLKYSMHSSHSETIICIPREGYWPRDSVRGFTSLRVVHVLRRNDRSYWELGDFFGHIHLTYLASNIPSSIIPSAISKLQNLRTLIIYRYGVYLPVEIWRLWRLRHLIAFSFCPLPDPQDSDLPLEKLQTLSLATDFVCSRRMVSMIPNIKKLGLRYSRLKVEGEYHLNNLRRLLQLEILKLEMPTLFRAGLPVFPPSLKKLNFSGGCFSWREVEMIGKLPNLQVLKLRNYGCHGIAWRNTDGQFRQLRVLVIDESNLQCWTTKSIHFPRLQCLMLHRCRYLSEIPKDIGEIASLQLIEVDDHNQSLLNSAKKMQDDLLDIYGINRFAVRAKRF